MHILEKLGYGTRFRLEYDQNIVGIFHSMNKENFVSGKQWNCKLGKGHAHNLVVENGRGIPDREKCSLFFVFFQIVVFRNFSAFSEIEGH